MLRKIIQQMKSLNADGALAIIFLAFVFMSDWQESPHSGKIQEPR